MKTSSLSGSESVLRRFICGSLLLLTWGWISEAQAATHIWQGPSGGNWSTAANWSGGVPTTGEPSGTIVQFGTNTTSTCNIVGLVVDQIHFTGGGNAINGTTPLGLNGAVQSNNIVSDTGTNTISSTLPIAIAGNVPIFISVPSGTLTCSSVISGNSSVKIFGAGTSGVKFGADNTYTGTTTVETGLLQLSSFGVNNVIKGPLVIGTGSGSGATVRLTLNQELPDNLAVTVNSDGTFDLANLDDNIGTLIVNGGTVLVGTTSLTAGPVTMNGGSITATTGFLSLEGNIVAGTPGGAVITSKINLNGDRFFTVNPGTTQPELSIEGVIGNGSIISIITKNGAGELQLKGSAANTFTGSTAIEAGQVLVNGTAADMLSGTVSVGTASGAAGSAILKLAQDHGLHDNVNLTVNATGKFDTGGVTDTINSLAINDGEVVLSSGTITTAGLTMTGGKIASGAAFFSGTLKLTGNVTASNSATQTPTISTMVDLNGAARTFQVNAGGPLFGLVVTGNLGDSTFTNGGLTKTGGGGMQFKGYGSYLGNTTISSGLFDLTGFGTLNGDSTVVVNGTGNLSGTGQTGPVQVTSANAIVSPSYYADARGSLRSSGNVDLGNGTLVLRINDNSAPQHDALKADGRLLFAATSIKIFANGPVQRNAYVLANYASLTSFGFTVDPLPSGYTLTFDYNDGSAPLHMALVRSGMIATGSWSNVTATSAKLSGTINPNGKPTSVYFQYGPTRQYGRQTALVKNLTGSAALPQSATITGLSPGTTYHYQLVAGNADGPINGADLSFTTPGALVTTQPATAVNALSADLNGVFNPNGNLTSVFFEYGLTPALGMKTRVIEQLNNSLFTPETFHLTGLQPNRTYYYRIAATNALGTSRGEILSFTTKLVLPPVLGFPLPASRVIGPFSSAFFQVFANEGSPSPTDAPLTYQWMKNGKAIPGSTLSFLNVSAALANAGTYTCVVKNVAGSVTSPPVELGVFSYAPAGPFNKAVGSSHTFTVPAAGNLLAYQWMKNGSPVPNNTNKSLILTNLQPADTGAYTCVVSNNGGSETFGAGQLNVFTAPPIILTPVTPARGIVGGDYTFTIPMIAEPIRAPTGFIVKGLPTGLKVDSKGVISGRITATQTAVQNYSLLITASNSAGNSAEVPATLTVDPYPVAANGTYNGTIERTSLSNNLGGKISLTISGIGSYTGTLTLAGKAYPISGAFKGSPGSAFISAMATIKLTPSSGAVFTLSAAVNGSGMTGSSYGITTTNLSAYRNPWSTSNPFSRSGSYTSQFNIQSGALIGNDTYPQGRGYASLTINPNGTVTVTAKMSDGSTPTPTTFSTSVDATGYLPVHFMLNGNTASVLGNAMSTPDVGTINGANPVLDGTVSWYKAPQPATSRLYQNGFPVHDLTWKGGIYPPPGVNTPVLSLTPTAAGVNNARFAVSFGGLTSVDSVQLSRPLRITTTNTADFSNPADGNPKNMKLTINAAKGTFNGSFTASSNRNVTFSGLLIPRTDVRAGAAFFLLPGTTPSLTTSPILSGEILLLPP